MCHKDRWDGDARDGGRQARSSVKIHTATPLKFWEEKGCEKAKREGGYNIHIMEIDRAQRGIYPLDGEMHPDRQLLLNQFEKDRGKRALQVLHLRTGAHSEVNSENKLSL